MMEMVVKRLVVPKLIQVAEKQSLEKKSSQDRHLHLKTNARYVSTETPTFRQTAATDSIPNVCQIGSKIKNIVLSAGHLIMTQSRSFLKCQKTMVKDHLPQLTK